VWGKACRKGAYILTVSHYAKHDGCGNRTCTCLPATLLVVWVVLQRDGSSCSQVYARTGLSEHLGDKFAGALAYGHAGVGAGVIGGAGIGHFCTSSHPDAPHLNYA
jgi:hypothetical protein